LWMRRAALVFTLPWAKERRDPERMLGWAVLLAEDRQWFIQKAVGWWLRELSKRDPKRVRRFLKDHGEKLTGVARREAMKYLTATSRLQERRRRASKDVPSDGAVRRTGSPFEAAARRLRTRSGKGRR